MSFNYQDATIEQITAHIRDTASIPSVSGLKAYYRKIGREDMVAKIDTARKILKLERMTARLALLKAEVSCG